MTTTPDISPSALNSPLVGVLALQGDVAEHQVALQAGGAATRRIRRPEDLKGVDGLVIPGGESTAIDKLSRAFGVAEPLRALIHQGLPVYGSCAGMILLADEIADPACNAAGEPQQTFGGLDVTVRRNAFGRQVDSFEEEIPMPALLSVPGEASAADPANVRAVFIRAPWIERVGSDVEILASVPLPGRAGNDDAAQVDRIVAVRSGNLLATSFHPEVTGERRIHRLFIQMIKGDA
ncbi:pyridoxal 5'-phosphate synthase glutaminase subunit PdxT [Zhihengliuella flava]|uniref:Pyridoxal 5'-phosphate synthase subunit PdxT n=1 Tax=Zhihengliuella flava TaxID=1285193 RepID=A0A931GDY4_9MICC|nr:pyridoxal 5'-phosphate synthase glutaminase subunit PdxT [Zhihengliuella flava]MBG6083465.1 5'-phosphate synthase pdxT subunit [Zhihengliuella flava]